MALSINQCKKILTKTSKVMTDVETEMIRNTFVVLADLAIDSFLAKRNNQKLKD